MKTLQDFTTTIVIPGLALGCLFTLITVASWIVTDAIIDSRVEKVLEKHGLLDYHPVYPLPPC